MTEKRWHKVAEVDELPDGRVTTVQAGTRDQLLAAFRSEPPPPSP